MRLRLTETLEEKTLVITAENIEEGYELGQLKVRLEIQEMMHWSGFEGNCPYLKVALKKDVNKIIA
jgi:hypothetical protein